MYKSIEEHMLVKLYKCKICDKVFRKSNLLPHNINTVKVYGKGAFTNDVSSLGEGMGYQTTDECSQ